LMSSGRTEAAIGVFRETERIAPKLCNAPYNLGTALIRMARDQEALEPLARALACYGREGRVGAAIPNAHFNRGVALSRLGRYREAEAHFRTCLRIAPDYPGGRIALGAALARQGKRSAGTPGEDHD